MQPQQQQHCSFSTHRSGRPQFQLSGAAAKELATALESLLKRNPKIKTAEALRGVILRLNSSLRAQTDRRNSGQLSAGDISLIQTVQSQLETLGAAATAALKIADECMRRSRTSACAELQFNPFLASIRPPTPKKAQRRNGQP
jgi:hypothetical protein